MITVEISVMIQFGLLIVGVIGVNLTFIGIVVNALKKK
jgi:hypothetical protein